VKDHSPTHTRRSPALLVATLVAALAIAGCQRDDAEPARSTTTAPGAASPTAPPPRPQLGVATPPPSTNADAIQSPGASRIEGGYALAFVAGMTWEETSAAVTTAAAAGEIVARGVVRETRALGGEDVDVRTQLLERNEGDVSSVRLTHFGDWLVGVLVTYGAPDPNRVLGYGQRFGQGVHGEGWVGWWLRDEQRIIQAATDGSSYEVFDLSAARRTVPSIDHVMLASWRQRYKVPPPWGYELLEEQRARRAGAPASDAGP
jgi:hypothetical protein